MKKRILTLIICAVLGTVSVSYADKNTEMSVMPSIEGGFEFDFSHFDSASQLPWMFNCYTTNDRTDFFTEGGISVSASEGESYLQTAELSGDRPFIVSFSASAVNTVGNASVYLRDNLPAHSGCELPLIAFKNGNITVFGIHSLEFDGGEKEFIAEINPNGKTAFYINNNKIFQTENIYELKPTLSNFNFGGFFLRFHTSAPSGSKGENKIKVTRVMCTENKSIYKDLSVSVLGLFRNNEAEKAPQTGTNAVRWRISNNSDEEHELEIHTDYNSVRNINKVNVPAGTAIIAEGVCNIEKCNRGDNVASFVAMEGSAVSEKFSCVSKGYEPLNMHDVALLVPNSHPRLIGNNDCFLKAAEISLSETPIGESWRNGYDADLANKLISKSASGAYLHVPCSYKDSDPLRLVCADTVLRYCKSLAGAFKLTGNTEYRKRLWVELENAGRTFPDWNPKHFLDTASITAAFAISYDWLYDEWTQSERDFIKNTLIQKGLSEYQKGYNGTLDSYCQWRFRTNNWNVVCNGGAVLGALALIDEEDSKELCSEVLSRALDSLSLALNSFSSDGAWYEGISYWSYSMQFLTLIMSSLKYSYNTLCGMDNMPNIEKTAFFAINTTGAYTANINDAGAEKYVSIPEYMFFASVYKVSVAGTYRMKQLKENSLECEIIDILWYNEEYCNGQIETNTPSLYVMSGLDLATVKCEKSFAAIHWGYNNISHGHLDGGTVFYDAMGERWLEDLGADDYNAYNYFNVADSAYPQNRWGYYRLRAEGHNTIVIGNDSSVPDQIPDSSGRIIKAVEYKTGAFAVVDMSGYYKNAVSVMRGIRCDFTTGAAVLCDEVLLEEGNENTPVYHYFHTRANAALSKDRKSVYLFMQDGETLKTVKMILLTDGEFTVSKDVAADTSPNPDLWEGNITLSKKQKVNNTKKITVAQNGGGTVQIAFVPLNYAEALTSFSSMVLPQLSQW